MLNKYLDRLEGLLDQYRSQELSQFQGPTSETAQWDDLIWFHVDPNTGRKTRFLCGRHGAKGKGSAGDSPDMTLPYPYSQLVKVWIIETSNASISASEKNARVSIARKLLSKMDGELFEQTVEKIHALLSIHQADRVNSFLQFCSTRGLIPPVRLKNTDNRDRTGHGRFDAAVEKLPDIEAILALGSIYNTLFQPDRPTGSVACDTQFDAFVTIFGLLGLASPNRLSAEVPVLPKQRLKAYSERGGEPVHYLDWFGSKGFKDNRNHVLAALAGEVERSINYFFETCEPARILCRFYENQQQTLKVLLAGFKIEKQRKKYLELDKVPNLFVLGYALGIYGVDDTVAVVIRGVNPPATRASGSRFIACFEHKPIYSLKSDDRLATPIFDTAHTSSIHRLFGYQSLQEGKQREALSLVGKSIISVSELQDAWINYYTNTILPEFPYSYSTGESKIRLADALFCFLGHWFYCKSGAGSGGKALQQSPYAVVPLRSVATKAAGRLTGGNGSGGYPSIFSEYGFPTLKIKPHSLRHFGNTLADLSEIPKEIITAWSGRLDKDQTNTYLHISHEERADRLRAVIGKPEHDKREVRIVTQEALMQGINLPATITSTGICTQELNVTPCDYLNDFVSQCFMCSASCHVAGDTKAIQFFEKDYEAQVSRLALVSKDRRLPNSEAMQKWFIIHSRNTHVLACLIDFLKKLNAGLIVRFSAPTSEFHITDPITKEIKRIQCTIPDFKGKLCDLILNQPTDTTSSANPRLQTLLSSFGLSDKTT